MNPETEIGLWIYARPVIDMAIEVRHAEVVQNMEKIESPFGWRDLTIPGAPIRKAGDLSASYVIRYPDSKVRCSGSYMIRDSRFIGDEAADDDKFSIDFDILNRRNDYRHILLNHFQQLIEAMGGYRAVAYYGMHGVKYEELHAAERERIRKSGNMDVNGRNNIFTLEPAHYWDAELCQRALGYGRDEVIRRLEGKVPLVQPLMDGVYVVFNDNPDLTFEEFCAVNDRFKPILGLV